MTILYGLVSVGKTVLAEHTSASGKQRESLSSLVQNMRNNGVSAPLFPRFPAAHSQLFHVSVYHNDYC